MVKQFSYSTYRTTPPKGHTSFGQEFVSPDRTNDKSTHPYSYSPFFHWKRPDWKKTDGNADSDRMRDSKYDKWREAWRSFPDESQLYETRSPAMLDKFLTIYFGTKTVCTALVESCHQQSGNPIYTFFFHQP